MVGFNDRGEHYAEQLADQQAEDQAIWTDAIREQLEAKGRPWLKVKLSEVIGAEAFADWMVLDQVEPSLEDLANEIISEGPGLAKLAAELELVDETPPPEAAGETEIKPNGPPAMPW